ncbi:small-conductance mechanosensitive channel [Aurantimicrobium minutum]|uniref:mechanosensitive ion channel family protein n=1 Tax=Aurantimicrobium minutum TaxID=708131 RepID=UPI0024753041|nr:mechanosensitive ion channel domain-containing protein [Aurantimicrobium minutum]MDH6532753.1 small-conductance mechanosensitive channel [Aurantimicrobium minutum]
MNITDTLYEIYHAASIPINIVVTVVTAAIIRWILLAMSRRVIRRMVTDAHNKNQKHALAGVPANITALRQVQRTQTMGTVFSNVISWLVISVAVIIVLQEIGVSVTAIVASAGIGAAALGFGAQNIVKDVLNGMFMVFEDQLGVGDRVDVGLAIGVVESVGVRITTIRGDDGTIWFVRNGEITRVGNMTYGEAAEPIAAFVKQPAKKLVTKKAPVKKAVRDTSATQASE